MNKFMNALSAVGLCMLMFGGMLWETEPVTGIVLVVISALIAVPAVLYTKHQEEQR